MYNSNLMFRDISHINPFTRHVYSGHTLEQAKSGSRLEGRTVLYRPNKQILHSGFPTDRSLGLTKASSYPEWALGEALHQAAIEGQTPVVLQGSMAIDSLAYKKRIISPTRASDSITIPNGDGLRVDRVLVPNLDMDWAKLEEGLKPADWDEAFAQYHELMRIFRSHSAAQILLDRPGRLSFVFDRLFC
jgi:hypothetical protein